MTCIPPAISGVVDADDGGAVRLRTDTTPPAAVLVVSDTKFAAWKSMFPAGLNKAVESKYNKTHRLWFVMTGIPADAPKDSCVINPAENVSVFWSGFRVPIDAGEWQPDPPETLPEVSYADIMRLCGFGEAAISPAPEPEDPIPQALRSRKQWLCWRRDERAGVVLRLAIGAGP
ncbi:MAG: hypothetical protein MJ014_06620 [Methanocorpusculum sp.]|nr:hypothetical protein [Methanocorpusculum sp.]